jgi:hypothetical protein
MRCTTAEVKFLRPDQAGGRAREKGIFVVITKFGTCNGL